MGTWFYLQKFSATTEDRNINKVYFYMFSGMVNLILVRLKSTLPNFIWPAKNYS
jgi:hypothetical protein